MNAILQIVPKGNNYSAMKQRFQWVTFMCPLYYSKKAFLKESPVVPALFLLHERKF